MEGRRALCLALLVSAVVSASSNGEPASGHPAAPTGPDTNVLCVSKCGTCPTVCSSPPPPPSPSDAGDTTTPPTPKSGGGGGSSSPPGQSKGGRPSNYYYFFTAAGSRSRSAGASVYALVFLALVSAVVASLQ
ncbi:classical arabinogalactan protein 5-like [Panicum miliaceum]|uniref:Classical arabinogalactan protein 5-like n=1 Tax=Panicum miliaceum TaxID=4540 RepID=A0A3L6T0Q2_PANMI|nr:classical arabinogalactan protein 5-like [Panicum miliaceum]